MKKIYAAEPYEALYDIEAGESEYRELIRDRRVKVYRARETRAGAILDVNLGAVWNAKGEGARARQAKRAQRPEVIERRNERETKRRIDGLINANFTTGDLAILLTFKEQPADPKKAVESYLRALRRRMSAEGQELKYLYMIETADRDGQELRTHVHLFVNAAAGRERAEQLWRKKHGIANATRLETDENGLSGFAAYIEKAPRTVKRQRRWAGSRNLIKPAVRRSTRLPGGRRLTKKLVLALVTGQEDMREVFERAYPGYRLIRGEVRSSGEVSGVWIDIRMTRYGGGAG